MGRRRNILPYWKEIAEPTRGLSAGPHRSKRHRCDKRAAYLPARSSTKVVPSAAGLGETRIPAAFIASILLSAPPLPPEIIAPAWPMRRPGGAVTPAMKPTLG